MSEVDVVRLADALWDALDAQHDKAWHVHAAECCWSFPGAMGALSAAVAPIVDRLAAAEAKVAAVEALIEAEEKRAAEVNARLEAEGRNVTIRGHRYSIGGIVGVADLRAALGGDQ